MSTKVRIAEALLAGAALVLVLAGCSASDQVVPYTGEAATLSVGETLIVDFGEINSSVGDGWVIVTEPDPAVLGEGESASEYLGDEGSTGAGNRFSYRFEAVGVGTTTIGFEYRFRGEIPEDREDQQTATIEVTVE